MIDRNPEVLSVRRSARLVLAIGVLFGVPSLVLFPLTKPAQVMLASDVYLRAGKALLAGEDIYAVTPPDHPGYRYIYPPIVVLAFVPHAVLGTPVASYAIQTLLNLGAGVGTALVLQRALVRRDVSITRFDLGLLVAFVLVSSYGAVHLVNGQVTLWLGFGFALGFDAVDRGRERLAGVAFGAAALVKVFPAAIGAWLLRVRAWRAVAAAVATGIAGLLLGVLALGPDLTVTFFTEVLTGRYGEFTFDGPPDPGRNTGGARRQIAALLGLGPPLVAILAFCLLAPPVAFLYRRVDTDERRQAAAFGTIAATLLFLPLQPLYFPLLVFPLVVLLYQLPGGVSRTTLVAGALLSFVRADYEALESAITGSPLPTAIETSVLNVTAGVFTVILPPTAGLWLLLVACVLIHRRDRRTTST